MADAPFPWRMRLRGLTVATIHTVPVAAARRWIPVRFPILRIGPGRTLGGLFLADYGPGSTLEYRELVAACAVVWHDRRPWAWVSHVFVDDAESRERGRNDLGVPKELARFVDEGDGRVRILDDDGPIATLAPGRPFFLWRQRLRFGVMHRHAAMPGLLALYGNELHGRIGILPAPTVEVPPGSPLRSLELGAPLLGICGEDLEGVLGGAPFLPFRTLAG